MTDVRSVMAVAMRVAEEKIRDGRILYRFPKAIQTREAWRQIERPTASASRSCLIDIRSTSLDGEQGRRFHALVILLARGGFDVFMVPRLTCLQSANKRHKRDAIHQARIYEPGNGPDVFDLCVTDHGTDDYRAKRTLRLTSGMLRELEDDELPLPYTLHPDIFERGGDARLVEHRERERQWKLFFGGHRYQHAYRETSYYPHQTVVNRYRIVEETLAHFGHRAECPVDVADFEAMTARPHGGVVFVDNAHYRIPAHRWLESVSRADFFVAAPGTTYPMSHNCVESLAVGTIPVLEYPRVLRPALRDGVNCLTYTGIAGFHDALERLDSLPSNDIQKMRLAAIDYYDKHLAPKAFCERLTDTSIRRLHMFAHLAKPAECVAA